MKEHCAAESDLEKEFPELYASFSVHVLSRPDRAEIWERTLRLARNCRPILDDLRARGMTLVRIDQYTPPGTDRQPLYQTLIEWFPRIQDPLTLSVCLSRLTEPRALALVKKNLELLLNLARDWHERLREADSERALAVLSQCVMKTVKERDLPEILNWARDRTLSGEARDFYVIGLERFARRPGLARDALLALIDDDQVGPLAVRALAGALKTEALPLLQDLQESSPHLQVRETARAAARKLEARSRRVDLPQASPAMLPQGYVSTSIEFDTDRMPELLSTLEQEMRGQLKTEHRQQLALSSNQLKRGQRRFHILPFTLSDGTESPLGYELHAEDEDVLVVNFHFDARLRDAFDQALTRFMNGDPG